MVVAALQLRLNELVCVSSQQLGLWRQFLPDCHPQQSQKAWSASRAAPGALGGLGAGAEWAASACRTFGRKWVL